MTARRGASRRPIVLMVLSVLVWSAGCPGPGSRPQTTGTHEAVPGPAETLTLTLTLGPGVTMELLLIRPGKFMMGSPDSEEGRAGDEGPQHEVTISQPFYMAATEVTQEQYEAVMGTNPSHFKGATNPVETVTWNDATEFCRRLSEKTAKAVRLPTEAEWEYACQAGSKTRFCSGDSDDDLAECAWYAGNSGGKTNPVGRKKPNAWGLYDMHGNVWEWCADWYGAYSSGAVTDPQGAASGGPRVLRGGSWDNEAGNCRAAFRYRYFPNVPYYFHSLGIRVVAPVAGVETPVPADLRMTGPGAKVETVSEPAIPEPAKNLMLTLGPGVTMELVLIRPGRFMMGSPDFEAGRRSVEGPQHEVTISKPFYLGVTEVTQAQYEALMGTNPSLFKGATNPVEMVSWNDAAEFGRRLSEKTATAVRLPTEAEWEYACRAGSSTRFCFGDSDGDLVEYAWYAGNSGGKTNPVGRKKPNAWGLHDMHGNVWEWCSDWYGLYTSSAGADPQGAGPGSDRVLRGGSWYSNAAVCRAAIRNSDFPDYLSSVIGFRVVAPVAGVGLK